MANKRSKSSPAYDWTMVQIDLSEADKKVFNSWATAHVGEIETLLDEKMMDGYKFSLTYSTKQNRYYATITQTDEEASDAKSSLTSHAGNWLKALMLTIWKHSVIGKGKIVERTLPDADDIG